MSQIVILIENVGDELEMSLDAENNLSPAGEGTQRERRAKPSLQGRKKPRNIEMKERRKKRKEHNGSNGGHGHEDFSGPHLPIILLDKGVANDEVIFKCANLFVVDVEFDPELRDDAVPDDPRRSPFLGWDTPQTSTKQTAGPFSGFHTVKGVFNNDRRKDSAGNDLNDTRPTDHMFYKATVWSEGLKVDPDYFCDR